MKRKIEELFHNLIYKYEKHCRKRAQIIVQKIFSDLSSALHQMQMADAENTAVKYYHRNYFLSKKSWIQIELAIPPSNNIYLSVVSHNSPFKRHKNKIIEETFNYIIKQTGGKFFKSGNNIIYECSCNKFHASL